MWSKAYEEAYGNKYFVYHGKKIPVKSLGLGSDYLGYFCKHIFGKCDGCIDHINYERIRLIRAIGDKKARAIAEALIACGVRIDDIPKEVEPTRLVENDDGFMECTNCHSELRGHPLVSSQYYRFCPMCGKKLKW